MKSSFFLFLLCLPLLAHSPAKMGSEPTAAPTLSIVNQIAKDEMIKQELVGLAIGVVQNGRITHLNGYGHMDEERRVPVTTSTVFSWASISKTLTAVAAFQLMEKSNAPFQLSSKVKKLIPELWTNEDDTEKITIEHLLSNRSGIRHYNKDRGEDPKYSKRAYSDTNIRSDWNAAQSVDVFENLPLQDEPGDRYRYSTFGFNLLGAVIDQKAKGGYTGWVADNIIGRLDLNSLSICRKSWTGFTKDCDGRVEELTEQDKRWVLPGGGWQSNIRDLTTFMNALMGDKLLRDPSKLWQPIADNENYCYGVRRHNYSSEYRVHHGGTHSNLRTYMCFFPESDFGIALMINGGYANRFRLFTRISTALGKSFSFSERPLTLCESDNEDCRKNLCGIWSKSKRETLIRRGIKINDFIKEVKKLKLIGYHCFDFDVQSNGLLVDAIFKRQNQGNHIVWAEDYDEFQRIWQSKSKKEHRLHDLETHSFNGRTVWSGIFIRSSGRSDMHRNLSQKDFEQKVRELKAEGLQLVDFEVYFFNRKMRWAGVWRQGPNFETAFGLSGSDFYKRIQKERKRNYRLSEVESWRANGQQLYSGVWVLNLAPDKFNRNLNYCQFASKVNGYSEDGYVLMDLEEQR